MNRTKIEWTDYTWNPITGCKHGCWYCYAKKMFTRFHRSFEPEFHPERLTELDKLKKPSKIFVCSVADLFATWTNKDWTDAVIKKIEESKYSHITFQLLTKNPENINVLYPLHKFPKNVWIGVTINNQEDVWKIKELEKVRCGIRFVSFEPLLGDIKYNLSFLDWIIIGKLTGSKKVHLQKEWVANLIIQAREAEIPIFIKNNVCWNEKLQEFPK